MPLAERLRIWFISSLWTWWQEDPVDAASTRDRRPENQPSWDGKATNTAQHWSHVASTMESFVYLAPYSCAGVLSTRRINLLERDRIIISARPRVISRLATKCNFSRFPSYSLAPGRWDITDLTDRFLSSCSLLAGIQLSAIIRLISNPTCRQ